MSVLQDIMIESNLTALVSITKSANQVLTPDAKMSLGNKI